METQSTNYSDTEISLYESPVYDIAKSLREKGYKIASREGIRRKKPTPDSVGILEEREPIKKNFLGIPFKKKLRAYHIATLWIHNEPRKAIEDKTWILQVNGKENIEKLEKAIKELSIPYKVKVKVELVNENPKQETYLSDYFN